MLSDARPKSLNIILMTGDDLKGLDAENCSNWTWSLWLDEDTERLLEETDFSLEKSSPFVDKVLDPSIMLLYFNGVDTQALEDRPHPYHVRAFNRASELVEAAMSFLGGGPSTTHWPDIVCVELCGGEGKPG